MQKRSVSIKSVIIIMALVTLVISVLLLMATNNTDKGYSRLSTNMDDYIQLQRDANDLQVGSDYLTEQVRCFAVTGKRTLPQCKIVGAVSPPGLSMPIL